VGRLLPATGGFYDDHYLGGDAWNGLDAYRSYLFYQLPRFRTRTAGSDMTRRNCPYLVGETHGRWLDDGCPHTTTVADLLVYVVDFPCGHLAGYGKFPPLPTFYLQTGH